MQTYNQFNQGNIMPLLMNFTTPTPIQEADDIQFTYNDGQQISYEMRMIGTRCLKTHTTRYQYRPGGYRSTPDRGNEIDDSKNVK